jgi:hypothetical protein
MESRGVCSGEREVPTRSSNVKVSGVDHLIFSNGFADSSGLFLWLLC